MLETPLLLVLHNHQPVGNLPWIFANCYREAYLPFLEALERHPGIRVGLHFTGPLLEWLQREEPAYLARVRALVQAGQVEVLGGGFYEPILPVIPERDRIGQLRLMRDTVAAEFGAPPRGAWLAERVWEPGLPAALRAADIEYVLIDDEAFHRIGYAERDTCAGFITEDDGVTVRILPISRRLRYTLPTQPVADVLQTLRAMVCDGAQALIYAEDGERYGSWPGTHDFLYGAEGYLDALFAALETADDLRLTLPSEYLAASSPRALVYLPPTSYAEMLEWSGGLWRNFLTRFSESNLMHKKMLAVSRLLAWAEQAGHDIADARRALYAGQCNCAYWYGVFGGIYFPHLRRAVYAHLLRAEHALASLLPPEVYPACERSDADCDGHEEIILRAGDLSAGIAPARGGGLYALEHLPSANNFLATMGRYPLPGHPDEHRELPVDRYPRFAFLDHFLAPDATLEAFRDARYAELGDFVTGRYAISDTTGGIVLKRQGTITNGDDSFTLSLEKRYNITATGLEVRYGLTNRDVRPRTVRFAVECHACLSGANMPERRLTLAAPGGTCDVSLADTRACADITGVCYRDDWQQAALALRWSQSAQLWVVPIYTPLRSLEGLEWVYQSTVALPVWEIVLLPDTDWQLSFTLGVETHSAATTAAL